MIRIPSLDGLRAIAILMVLLSHSGDTPGAPTHHFSSFGYFGVRIFFVISGFLITRLLVMERETTGTVSLKQFYYRRTLRIFPALWFYLFVIAALNARGRITLLSHDLLSALTYTVNYHQARSWFVGHLWSLSVEEQFYLIWPLIIIALSRRRAAMTAMTVSAVAPVLRAILLLQRPDAAIGEWFPTVCDGLAAGCALGLLPDATLKRFFSPFNTSWFAIIPAVAICVNLMQYHSNPRYGILFASLGQSVMNCSIALTLGWLITFPESLAGRVLNSPFPVWIGTISYSLYLWQQPFLNRDVHTWMTSFPLNVAFAFLMAMISYYFVERPILRCRNRLAHGRIRATAGTARASAAIPDPSHQTI
jgi:peptidoglycan/LPS O-acetylase OafA/YrhL